MVWPWEPISKNKGINLPIKENQILTWNTKASTVGQNSLEKIPTVRNFNEPKDPFLLKETFFIIDDFYLYINILFFNPINLY